MVTFLVMLQHVMAVETTKQEKHSSSEIKALTVLKQLNLLQHGNIALGAVATVHIGRDKVKFFLC
jgi:hypothetical protein